MNHTKNISCIIVDDELMAREIIATHLSKINNMNVIASCKNAMEALDCINTSTIDLVFLDINMPELSGISFAKLINRDIKIIFTTAYRNYAVEGFELQAVDYLLKPISFERLLKAVNTYFEVYVKQHTKPTLPTDPALFMFVRSDRKMLKIDFQTILYIESYGDYLKIHLDSDTIIIRDTMSTIEAKLPNSQFIRIHRSCIVATANISAFTNEHVVVNNKALTISRSYRKDVLSQLEHY